MPSWSTLLTYEQIGRQQLDAEVADTGHTLFKKFAPNVGGQAKFFELTQWTTIEPLNHRWSALIGGIGAGKSYSGAVWACSRALLDPKSRGLITANTFGQLSRATLIELAHVCSDYNIRLEPWRGSLEDTALAIANMQRCYIGEERAFVYVLSMNSFMGKTQAARGLQVKWALCDECSFAPEQAFLTLDGRLGRGPGSLKGQGAIVTSPNSFNWLYDRFADPQRSEEKKKLYVMVSCSTRENVKHLGEDYVAGLQTNYTDELAAQELEGQFINTSTGRIYKYFDRKRHALGGTDAEILEYDNSLPLHISFDFNASPAICVLSQCRGNEIHVFNELYQMDSDTWELAATLTDWIKAAAHASDIYIYGDATGKARTAASRLSCWDIVFNAFKDIGYKLGSRLHRRFDESNPPVVNRINSVNCLFKQDRVYVDLNNCKELIKDLEMLSWDGDGIDKSDRLRSHLSDAMGYLIHKLYPYRAIATKTGVKQQPLKGLVS